MITGKSEEKKNHLVNGVYFSQWLNKIMVILQGRGLEHFWNNQFDIPNMAGLKVRVKVALQNMYKEQWNKAVNSLSKFLNYRVYNQDYKLENYFVKLSTPLSIFFCRFRCINIRLLLNTVVSLE